MRRFETVSEYIAAAPEHTHALLKQMRTTIRKAAPNAEESISYMMPYYACEGVLCYFAGYERHIGFYPTGSAIVRFATELKKYKTSKGAVQFPVDAPLPLALIRKMVTFRVKENRERHPFASLSAPARRALAAAGITTLRQLTKTSEKKLLSLHGLGPSALPKIRALLR